MGWAVAAGGRGAAMWRESFRREVMGELAVERGRGRPSLMTSQMHPGISLSPKIARWGLSDTVADPSRSFRGKRGRPLVELSLIIQLPSAIPRPSLSIYGLQDTGPTHPRAAGRDWVWPGRGTGTGPSLSGRRAGSRVDREWGPGVFSHLPLPYLMRMSRLRLSSLPSLNQR